MPSLINNKVFQCGGTSKWASMKDLTAYEHKLETNDGTATPIEWCFAINKNDCEPVITTQTYHQRWPYDEEHRINQLENLSIANYYDHHLSQFRKERVMFFKARFVFFAEKVNKKCKQVLNGGEKYKLIGTGKDGLESFVHYFRLQNRFMTILEQEGKEAANKIFYVTKSQLTVACANFSSHSNVKELEDLISRYYFGKYPWYGEIGSHMDVVVSDEALSSIVKIYGQTWLQLNHLCLYIYLLSKGQGVIGISMQYLYSLYSPPSSSRLQPHPDFALTWLAFERLAFRHFLGAAFVPQRIPQFKMNKDTGLSEFTGFKIRHYAALLGIKHQPNNNSILSNAFDHCLSRKRLQPFLKENFYFAMSKPQVLERASVLRLCDMNHIFKNRDGQQSGLKSLHDLAKIYEMAIVFKLDNIRSESTEPSFQGSQNATLYSKNDSTGLWEYDPAKANKAAFLALVSSDMPQWYISEARRIFNLKQEALLLAPRFGDTTSIKQSSQVLCDDIIRKQEKMMASKQALSQILSILPTLHINLNAEQLRIMNSQSNVFILGRSGTGKTTTTVLRFFCQETLYRAVRKQARMMNEFWLKGLKAQYKEAAKALPRLDSEDIAEDTQVRMVFVTASPVLTNEVKQYYARLKLQLTSHLAGLEDIRSSIDKQPDGQSTESQAERKKLFALIEQKEQEAMQEDAAEQQHKLPESFAQLQPHHFPLFLTVQRLVYMLDASLKRSFFTRTDSGKIIGMESSLGWHNEDSGVFMINQDFKQSEQLRAELQDFELQILSRESAVAQSAEELRSNGQLELIGTGMVQQDKLDVQINHINDRKTMEENEQNRVFEGVIDSNFRQAQSQHKEAQMSKKQKRLYNQIDQFPLCTEVTFEVFQQRFITRYFRLMSNRLSKKMSPIFVWTEIMSVIKGSVSGEYQFQNHLTQKEYELEGSVSLTRKEKSTLYYLFLKYEEWKLNMRAFDFLDVVNHVMYQMALSGQVRADRRIDYLIIDEVQDLYPKTAQLLLKQTRYKVVFAGDTAQTISRGVTLRISDLQKVISNNKMALRAESVQLSVNYRSQNSILQLANNVVKLIQTIFPWSIDSMTEEVSQRLGPKPIILAPMGDKLLCHFFFGQHVDSDVPAQVELDDSDDFEVLNDSVDTGEESKSISRAPHFGASQVIIVREQSSKDQLPAFMRGMLCLTVYEAKGLEFDDVILFNFFAMGDIQGQQWKLINHVSEEKTCREVLPDWVLDLDEAERQSFVENGVAEALAAHEAAKTEEQEEEKKEEEDPELEAKKAIKLEEELKELIEQVGKTKSKEYRDQKVQAAIAKYLSDGSNEQFIKEWTYSFTKEGEHASDSDLQRKFSQLCQELKFLYVAITRPRNRLYIYDENVQNRKPIESIWRRIDAVQWVAKEEVKAQFEQLQKPSNMILTGAMSDIKLQGSLINQHTGQVAMSSDVHQWKLQGMRFFKQKNYEQAIKCFNIAGSRDLVMRCKAYIAATKAQELQTQTDVAVWELKRRLPFLHRRRRQEQLEETKQQRLETCRLFSQAGAAFERARMEQQAATCFFTARSYNKAAELFKRLDQWAQAAECLVCLGQTRLKEAAQLFERGGLVLRAIECYERIEEWEYLLHCLNRNQASFGEAERQTLVQRYVPIALNNIYSQHQIYDKESIPAGDAHNLGQRLETKIKDKYKAAGAVIEEEEHGALDEYGEELVFDEEDGEEELELEEEEEKETESMVVLSDDDEDDSNRVMSKDFQMEEIIKEQYRARLGSLLVEPEESKSFVVIDDEEKKDDDADADDINSQGSTNVRKDIDLTQAMKNAMTEDSFEHLSQFDPDDQLIKSDRSFSLIESYMGCGGGKSQISNGATSEFSIISAPNVKSIVFSALSSIEQQAGVGNINFIEPADEDNYTQDVIAQKIIYYLSLWSSDMRNQLDELKQKGVLQEAEKENREQIDETDFIIQMDDVNQEFVELILDTLEVYEFYHMSLMMCKRYGLSGRQGRYLVLMCTKYSNLNAFRTSFQTKLNSPKFRREQHLCSLLAHEAIHNVLGLIDQKCLKLKAFGEKLTDENSLGIQTYRNMLNLGFWKKLVYVLEKKTALELCLKFSDFTNFWLLTRAFLTQEEKMANRRLLDEWTLRAQLKDYALKSRAVFAKLSIKGVSYRELATELTIGMSETIKAAQLNQRTLQEMLQVRQHIGEFIDVLHDTDMLYNERRSNLTQSLASINKIVSEQLAIFHQQDSSLEYASRLTAANLAFDLLFAHTQTVKMQRTINGQILAKLSCLPQLFALLKHAYEKVELGELTATQDPIMDALLTTFLVSHLDSEQAGQQSDSSDSLFESYQAWYVLVSVESPLMPDIAEIQSFYRERDLCVFTQSLYTKCDNVRYFFDRNRTAKVREVMSERNLDNLQDQWKNNSRKKAFIADMDAKFVYVPKEWVKTLLLTRITSALAKVLRPAPLIHFVDETTLKYCQWLAKKLKTAESSHGIYADAMDSQITLTSQKVLPQSIYTSYARSLRGMEAAIVEKLQTTRTMRYVSIAKLQPTDLNYIQQLFAQSLVRGSHQDDQVKLFYSDKVRKGLEAFNQRGLPNPLSFFDRQLMQPDQDSYTLSLMIALHNFLKADNYMMFLELYRGVAKKVKMDFENLQVFKTVMHLVDVHVLIRNSQWVAASYEMLAVGAGLLQSSIVQKTENLDETLMQKRQSCSYKMRISCLELATFVAIMLKFGTSYLPDYALHYLDNETNFTLLYNKDYELEVAESSLAESNQKKRPNQSQNISIAQHSTKFKYGHGRRGQGIVDQDEFSDGDYYAEEVGGAAKGYGQDDDYYEEQEVRTVINKTLDAKTAVETPDSIALNHLYELTLSRTVKLITEIGQDEKCLIYKAELQRLFNLLMTYVVNGKVKSKKACQMLGLGFHQLVKSPLEDYFIQAGVPTEWSTSSTGALLTNSDFEGQVIEFDAADEGLKWQWFVEIETGADFIYGCQAYGYYVAKVDISAAQSPESQVTIREREQKSILSENRQLALRMAAARTITKAAKRWIEKKRKVAQTKQCHQVRIYNHVKEGGKENEEVLKIIEQARSEGLMSLTKVPNIALQSFLDKLAQLQLKANYLQELMVAKAFSSSLEVSKAINYMDQLSSTRHDFVRRARLFAEQQLEIMETFELLAVNEEGDDMQDLNVELSRALHDLDSHITTWLELVFQGDSQGIALKAIVDAQAQAQSRLKLKWHQLQKSSGNKKLQMLNKIRRKQ